MCYTEEQKTIVTDWLFFYLVYVNSAPRCKIHELLISNLNLI